MSPKKNKAVKKQLEIKQDRDCFLRPLNMDPNKLGKGHKTILLGLEDNCLYKLYPTLLCSDRCYCAAFCFFIETVLTISP